MVYFQRRANVINAVLKSVKDPLTPTLSFGEGRGEGARVTVNEHTLLNPP